MDVRKVIFWMVHTTMHKVEVWELCGVTSTFSPDTENNKSIRFKSEIVTHNLAKILEGLRLAQRPILNNSLTGQNNPKLPLFVYITLDDSSIRDSGLLKKKHEYIFLVCLKLVFHFDLLIWLPKE